MPRLRIIPLLFVLTAGCSGSDRPKHDAEPARRDAAPGSAAAAPRTRDSGRDAVTDSIVAAIRACPRDGLWHECSVTQRLELSGLRPRAVDSVTGIPGIPRDARLWQIGRQSLRVLFFASEAEATAALAGLDSARAAPRGDSTVIWTERPTLIRSVNLLALMLGGTERQVERVSNALTAGPPQPER